MKSEHFEYSFSKDKHNELPTVVATDQPQDAGFEAEFDDDREDGDSSNMSRTDSKVGDLSMNSAILLGSDVLCNGVDILWNDNSFQVSKKQESRRENRNPAGNSKVAQI